MRIIQETLHRVNPYANLFRSGRELGIGNANVRLRLNSFAQAVVRGAAHERTYNAPTTSEVGAFLLDGELGDSRDLILNCRDGRLQRIKETHAGYDPLQYPLLFPFGSFGWSLNIPLQSQQIDITPEMIEEESNGARHVSIRQFACYRMQVRRADGNIVENVLHIGGRLFQQYLVDQWAKAEQNRLNFFRMKQSKIRAASYSGLSDAIIDGVPVENIGRIVLPSSFHGGARFMNQQYQDSMPMVRHFATPTFLGLGGQYRFIQSFYALIKTSLSRIGPADV